MSHHHFAILLFTISCAVCAERAGPQTEQDLILDESILGKALTDLHDGKWGSPAQLDSIVYEFYGLKTVVGYRVIIHPEGKLDYYLVSGLVYNGIFSRSYHIHERRTYNRSQDT